ncbi:MAG: helix-turn-helix domain-containing protein [Thermoanaerobaculaceae bacterium]|jgi:hypothetical protein|nr:helix-turn-helix domain-containing protein [Thermoanaerobaculaceae bacterium]
MRPWDDLDPWELLGVPPGASVDEIRQAFQRLDLAFSPGSLALYSVVDPEEQVLLQRQLRTAYQRLLRAAGANEPAPAEASRPAAPARPAAAPPPPAQTHPTSPPRTGPPELVEEINSGRAVTGDLLRQTREAWGLSLEAVAKRTRIQTRSLAAIEAEDFPALPARVFVRGFVIAYARELRLDPEHAWSCFERRWQAHGPIPRPGLPGV